MMEKLGAGREWVYPEVEGVMNAAGLHPIAVYTKRRNMTIA